MAFAFLYLAKFSNSSVSLDIGHRQFSVIDHQQRYYFFLKYKELWRPGYLILKLYVRRSECVCNIELHVPTVL